jgi:hypothetical protein
VLKLLFASVKTWETCLRLLSDLIIDVHFFFSVAWTKEGQAALAPMLLGGWASYVDQTTHTAPHLGSCYLATSNTHTPPSSPLPPLRYLCLPRILILGYFAAEIFSNLFVPSHDIKWAKTNDMSAAIRITITQLHNCTKNSAGRDCYAHSVFPCNSATYKTHWLEGNRDNS